jgi:8-oxo-dGTP diphosphatase
LTVYAAGVVCWRVKNSNLEVALVHREYYKDWGFPKGKQDPGETLAETAVRETMEEAGFKVKLGRKLGVISYKIPSGENKEVHYWASLVSAKAIKKSKFEPNGEIASIEWVSAKKALGLLSYEHDRELLVRVMDLHKGQELETKALILLRHAPATSRIGWFGYDGERTLTEEGKKVAQRLVPLLSAFGPKRIVTSPWKRCVDTVAPFAKKKKLKIIERFQLSERKNSNRPKSTENVVRDEIFETKNSLICSHRPALPSILDEVAKRANVAASLQLHQARSLKPGDFAVVRLTKAKKPKVAAVEFYSVEEARPISV